MCRQPAWLLFEVGLHKLNAAARSGTIRSFGCLIVGVHQSISPVQPQAFATPREALRTTAPVSCCLFLRDLAFSLFIQAGSGHNAAYYFKRCLVRCRDGLYAAMVLGGSGAESCDASMSARYVCVIAISVACLAIVSCARPASRNDGVRRKLDNLPITLLPCRCDFSTHA